MNLEASVKRVSFSHRRNFRGKSVVEWATGFRSSWLQRPDGDQGLFLSRGLFEKIGTRLLWQGRVRECPAATATPASSACKAMLPRSDHPPLE